MMVPIYGPPIQLQMLEPCNLLSLTLFLHLVMTNFCLKYLQALTSNLQAETKDIVVAVKEINDVIMTLQNVRTNIETYHSQWFTAFRENVC